MKTSQKGFAFFEALLIVLVLSFAAAAGYYVYHSRHDTNRPSQTSDNIPQGWKLYTSPTKSFTLLYPSGWNHYTPKLFSPSSTALDAVSFGPSGEDILVQAVAGKSSLSPKQYATQDQNKNTQVADLKINGYDAVSITYTGEYISTLSYAVKHGGVIVRIDMILSSRTNNNSADLTTDHAQYVSQFDQLAKSIKFTN